MMEQIKSPEELANIVRAKRKGLVKPESTNKRISVSHADAANQIVKMVNVSLLDPFVKKVMTERILGPLMTGKERTHMSIALEIGADVDEVIAAEQFGIRIIDDLLQKVSSQEFIDKFNKDETVRKEVEKVGKSLKEEVQKGKANV